MEQIKYIIELIGGLFILFIVFSGVSISLKPLKFSLDNPVFGIGAIVMLIGFAVCIGASQWRAVENHKEKTGYYKGYEKGVEDAFQCIKEKSNKKDEKVQD